MSSKKSSSDYKGIYRFNPVHDEKRQEEIVEKLKFIIEKIIYSNLDNTTKDTSE